MTNNILTVVWFHIHACTLKTTHCVYSCVLAENPCCHSLQTLIAETRLLDVDFFPLLNSAVITGHHSRWRLMQRSSSVYRVWYKCNGISRERLSLWSLIDTIILTYPLIFPLAWVDKKYISLNVLTCIIDIYSHFQCRGIMCITLVYDG